MTGSANVCCCVDCINCTAVDSWEKRTKVMTVLMGCCEHGNEQLGFQNEGNFLTSWRNISFFRTLLLHITGRGMQHLFVTWILLEVYFWGLTLFTSHISARKRERVFSSVTISTLRYPMHLLVQFSVSSKRTPLQLHTCPPPHTNSPYTRYTGYVRTAIQYTVLA